MGSGRAPREGTSDHQVLLCLTDEGAGPRWLAFRRPREVLVARRLEEVVRCLGEVEAATRSGLHAAGFVAYEAAPAFDPALAVRSTGPLPLLWFGLYDAPEEVAPPPAPPQDPLPPGEWRLSVSEAGYHHAIGRIKEAIAAGETYQVNYTLRLRRPLAVADPRQLFAALVARQEVPAAAYVELPDHALCSASPELFFSRRGSRVVCRPMKGTAPRAPSSEADEARGRELAESAKNRAENLMIVDMVRNDLGRVARPGTVDTPELFRVERYATLWQMTSTVVGDSDAPLPELFAALFPSASVTGAPKASTMELIAALEDGPRGIYTGAVGWAGPGGRAHFNVAIRTLWLDRRRQVAEYGTGGGIVWDSDAAQELTECRTKARVLAVAPPSFRLLETLLWRPGRGFFLLDRHLKRLARSAGYFGFRPPEGVAERLEAAVAGLLPRRHRVRLLVDRSGEVEAEVAPLPARTPRPVEVGWATVPVARDDLFLYHKTTRREVYEAARRSRPECDDVLLWNGDGEATESTLANLVVRLEGQLLTPPLASGLLPGIYREHLLAAGRIRERRLTREEVEQAEGLYLINSVRGWVPGRWVAGPEPGSR